jgi:putative nucleotidyltransferase with HDIG domain
LAVCRTDDRPLSPGALALLDDVRGLVVAALEAVTARTRPPERAAAAARPAGAAAPSTDFHHRLPKAFERLEGLPALSASRDTLLAVLEDPAPSQLAIVRAIESDIALLIAVLRLANEARRARRPQIWSVPDAIQALTPEGVETMARRMTVFDFFQRVAGWAIPPERFRLHAILTQRAAQQLARVLDHPDPDHLIVAALLHDVGKLVLMEAFANYPEQVVRGGGTPEQRLRAERQALGLDHQMAGGVLLRRWRLPERLAEIVGHHHNPGDDRDATIIQLADALALYAQSQPVSPAELERTAAAVGVTTPQLRTLMFELSRPEGQAPRSSRTLDPSPLSKRETEMLQRLAEGLTYKDIAQATGLSISTVRTHLNNVYKKLDVSDRAQAVLTATARGWI